VRIALAAGAAVVALACGGSAPPPDSQGGQAAPPPESEAPVALNADVPIAYPPPLFDQKIEGDVVLRMYTDSTGRLIPESTRVADGSGYPALDSAALAGSSKLRFAPAKRRGIPVATAFLQPVEFRYPGTAGAASSGPLPSATVPAPTLRPTPRPQAPPVQARVDTTRARPDTTRPVRADTARRADTTRPARTDTTRPPPTPPPPTRDTSGTAP
jgi:protein TonB